MTKILLVLEQLEKLEWKICTYNYQMEIINNDDLDVKIQSYKHGQKMDIENFYISEYRFVNIRFEYTGLRKNIFENCIFENVIFYDMYLSESVFKNCHFKNCEFLCIEFGIYHVKFENSIHIETIFRKTDCLESSFISTYFLNCNFEYFDVSGCIFKECRIIDCINSGLIYSPGEFNDGNMFYPSLTK